LLSLPLTDSGRYAARGRCTLAGQTRALEAHFKVLRQNSQLRIEGFIRLEDGQERDFRLRLRFGTSILAGGRFEYSDADFRQLSGSLAWAQDCYLMAGHCYAPNASVSIHLHPREAHNHFELRGLFSPALETPVAFALAIAPHRQRLAAATDGLVSGAT
jgi:hypothetical protein